jgi:acetyl-CoA acyltransferase
MSVAMTVMPEVCRWSRLFRHRGGRHAMPLPCPAVRPVMVIDAVRTPIGARGGLLSGWHPADLTGFLLTVLLERTGARADQVGQLVLGCAMPVGSQGFNVARSSALAAGWPVELPAVTVDAQGVSSLAAIAVAARAVASGACDLAVAGGVEVMSTTPPGATLVPGAQPFGPAVATRFRDAGGLVPAGVAADRLAEAAGLDRADLDAYALASHRRAAGRVADAGVVPVAARVFDRDRGEVVHPAAMLTADQQIRTDLTEEELASARPLFSPEGRATVANSAPAGDGAAVVLLASMAAADALGRAPLAGLAGIAELGVDPVTMLTGLAAAVAGVAPDAGAVDRYEVGEPFAAVPLAWIRGAGVDPARVNPGGGGLALGEPTGAAGARQLVTLAHDLAAGGGRRGVAAGVGVGGLATALLLERRS